MAVRDKTYDFYRGILIFLVTIGHCIQCYYIEMGGNFYNNILFKIIYSFHMPAFMFLSGWLFHKTLTEKSLFYILKLRT